MGKRGRKRAPGIKRTASGRRSRAASAYEENAEPIETRMRLYGLNGRDARDQKAATFVGRLQLTGVLTQEQYDAAQQFLAVYEAYQRALKTPDALRSSSGGGDQGESENYARWCRAAVERYDNSIKAVRNEQNLFENRGSNLYGALDLVVARDQQLPHLVSEVRVVLSTLARHFQIVRTIDDRVEAAWQCLSLKKDFRRARACYHLDPHLTQDKAGGWRGAP